MPDLYRLVRPGPGDVEEVHECFPSIAELPEPLGSQVTAAWASAWRSSGHARLADAPYSLHVPDYSLVSHTNEVADLGMQLSGFARDRWGADVDQAQLRAALLLHDIDKALLYVRDADGVSLHPHRSRLPHGVLGAMLAHDAGLPEEVVVLVATHATTSPQHDASAAGWILHYADLFAADHAFRLHGRVPPFYLRMHTGAR